MSTDVVINAKMQLKRSSILDHLATCWGTSSYAFFYLYLTNTARSRMAVGVRSSLAGTQNQIIAPRVIEGISCTGLLCRKAFHEGSHALRK